ncbi:MAG: ubiquinone biosynthesis protein UbiA [Chloroflexi bacterium RIFCSPLOWO2_12_FULL_71_12]|nr:MAG: ubiquinone biosynthesis protein UbiA [Chloroflexi bacterium RIFCSPLOWO2_12_FULL_71_12]
MWVRALRVIPRIDKPQWDALDIVSKWLIAVRGAVLVITFISAGIAGLLAARVGSFDLLLWSLLTAGLILAHATNNLVNDLIDHRKGVDRDNYFRAQYGPHPLEHGLMTERQLIAYAAATGGAALAMGIALVGVRGPLALALLAAGAFFVLLYTYPLKYIGLGELAVLIVWGPLMIGGGYFVITGTWDWNAAAVGLPYALGATTVIFGKHIDKIDDDRARGIRTFPVVVGEAAARWIAIAMLVGQYVSLAALVLVGYFSPVVLVVLLALPKLRDAVSVYVAARPRERPERYPADAWPLWFVAYAFAHNRRFGMLFLLGLIADVGLRLVG